MSPMAVLLAVQKALPLQCSDHPGVNSVMALQEGTHLIYVAAACGRSHISKAIINKRRGVTAKTTCYSKKSVV